MDTGEKKKKLRVKECQRMLGLGRSSTYRVLQGEREGVYRIYVSGSIKPVIVVEPEVIERILRRSSTRS